MRHLIGLTSAVLLSIVVFSGPASAWSERNCKSECARRMPGQEAACVVQFNCAQYRGGRHVGAGQQKVKADSWSRRHGYQR